MNSKQKGKRGELEFVHFLKERGVPCRRGQQYQGGTDSPDVIAEGYLSNVHLEVKRCETGNLYNWMDQAKGDAPSDKTPVVVHRRNGKDWVAILDAKNFLKIMELLNARYSY